MFTHVQARKWAAVAGMACALMATPAFAQSQAVTVSGQVTADSWRNLRGGLKRGSASLYDLQLRVDVDAEQAFGWRGASLSASVLHHDGRSPSAELLGDLQAVDNKDATEGSGLYEAWLRQSFGRGYVKAGVVDLNTEFSAGRASAVFINGAQGLGLDMAQLGASGPSVYPAPRYGLVAALDGKTSVKAGFFDGGPALHALRRRATESDEHGLLAVGEAAHETSGGVRVAVGAWRRSGEFGSALEPVSDRASVGGYAMVEGPLWRTGERRLDGYVRIAGADAKVEQIATTVAAGLVLDRPFRGADGEYLGLAVISARNGEHFRRLAKLAGASPYKAETVVELTYRRPVTSWLSMQPDVQYVIHPGAERGRRNALLVGVRLDLAWSAGR